MAAETVSKLEHEITGVRREPGELSFEARVGDLRERVWLRTETPVEPNADAALAACLMPAMRHGGSLTMSEPVSPRLLRNQRQYQSFQRAWSRRWRYGEEPLREVEVEAPTREPRLAPAAAGRVAAFFSGGVDSWANVLDTPELTDLIFVRGVDLLLGAEHQRELIDEVDAQLRAAAADLALTIHVVETNLRDLSDRLVRWEAYCGCALDAVALFLAPLFERVLIAGDLDHEVQSLVGVSHGVDSLWSTESLEISEAGGALSRVERVRKIASNPTAQRTLRVCWRNPDGAYNCGRCNKCLQTMITLEAIGARAEFSSFPSELPLDQLDAIEFIHPVSVAYWEDLLDTTRAAGRVDLEQAVEGVLAREKRKLGIPIRRRSRAEPGPSPTVRVAVVVPAYEQAQFMAAAIQSALDQELLTGVGVVIVNDGCPDPRTTRIGRAFRDAHPDRVSYLHQANGGPSAARNAGIRRAIARWPQVEAVFPLDADNLLSPGTIAALLKVLDERPDAAWASPALEVFGDGDGTWGGQEPYLSYRQLFSNQSDTGSLIRRSVFEAGIEFDESLFGYEDWELFLRASLAGLHGAFAGPCGFRYRDRPGSLRARSGARAEEIEAGIRERHPAAYEPGALARREHGEAPRFALVRCDRGDALLTAACDLPPHEIRLQDLLLPRRQGGRLDPVQAHVPAVTVLTTAEAIEWLRRKALLADALLRLQQGLATQPAVALRIGRDPERRSLRRHRDQEPPEPAALAMRTRSIAEYIADDVRLPIPEQTIDVYGDRGRLPGPLPVELLESAVAALASGVSRSKPLIVPNSQAQYLEHLHLDEGRTTLPWAGTVSA